MSINIIKYRILPFSPKYISNEFKKSIKISSKRMLSIGIIGAPTSAGQLKPGVHLGPNAIRSADLLNRLENLGHNVIDFGDFGDFTENLLNHTKDFELKSNDNKLKNQKLVKQMWSQLSGLVAKVVQSNRIPLTLGGDHSIAIASIASNCSDRQNEEISVLWVDAHADINTVETTRTGNFHGMAVSFLVKQIQQMFNNPNRNTIPVKPCIDSKNIGFIGLRDVEPSELEILSKTNITHFTTKDVDKLGINEVIARTLDKINPQLKRKIHVSFDIDALDPMWAPSTGTAVTGGLTLREALTIGEEIYATKMLCGLDLVEVNPSIGEEKDVEKTINCAINIIASFFGKTRIGNYMLTEDRPN